MKSDATRSTTSTEGLVPDVSGMRGLSTFEKARFVGFGLVVLAIVGFAAVALGELFSLLVRGWTAEVGTELGIHRLHVMVIATTILTTLLGVFVQVYRPTRQAASILGALGSVVVAAVITAGVGESLGQIVPFMAMIWLATLLHPAGRELLQRGDSYSPAMLALVVVAAAPMVAFALGQMSLQLDANDAHAAAGHYTVMAQLGLVPLVYGALAAIGMRGWRVAAWIAALPVAYYGLLSVSFTGQAGSTGIAWGAGAIIWAVGFVAVAEYSRVAGSPILRHTVAEQD